MKKVLFIFLFCLCSFLTAKEKIIEKSLSNPVIVEKKTRQEHKFIKANGMLFLKGKIKIEKNISIPIVFLIDTGSATSSLIYDGTQEYQDYFNYVIDGIDYCLCNVEFESFHVNNLYLYKNTSSAKELKQIFSDTPFFGILGNDVLMNKSFFLSITKGYFKWIEGFEFSNKDKVIVPLLDRIHSKRGTLDCYQYTIYIQDDYFKSDENDVPVFGFFNSPDNSKSRYYIDTGTYYIATSLLDLFYQVKKHNYPAIFYKTEIETKTGFCLIKDADYLGKQFSELSVCAGYTPELIKSFGNQILGAFDIYFDKEKTNVVQKIYLSPVDEKDYESFREENDNSYYFHSSTYGFKFSALNGRVNQKAFLNEKEMIKELETGDMIISINGIPVEKVNEFELPDEITIQYKKRSGKVKEIRVKKVKLK